MNSTVERQPYEHGPSAVSGSGSRFDDRRTGLPVKGGLITFRTCRTARAADDGELEVPVLGSLSVHAGQVGLHRDAVAFASRARARYEAGSQSTMTTAVKDCASLIRLTGNLA
jgi:hypothetical protein